MSQEFVVEVNESNFEFEVLEYSKNVLSWWIFGRNGAVHVKS